jgi:hypothetical protein
MKENAVVPSLAQCGEGPLNRSAALAKSRASTSGWTVPLARVTQLATGRSFGVSRQPRTDNAFLVFNPNHD